MKGHTMSTATTDSTEFEPIRWPEDPADYTIEDHQIVAAHIASAAIEHYWGGMQARPALLDFEAMVADHYSALKHEEASHTPAF